MGLESDEEGVQLFGIDESLNSDPCDIGRGQYTFPPIVSQEVFERARN